VFKRIRRFWRDDEGQALVEGALVLPAMTFLVIGTIQLVMIQHARVMTEYAAFQATRAGIVHNANRKMMLNGALIALLPTMGATDSVFGKNDPFRNRRRPGIMQTWLKAKGLLLLTNEVQCGIASLQSYLQDLAQGIPGLNIPAFTPRVGLVSIDMVNPTQGDLPEEELDFDCLAGTCQGVPATRARAVNRMAIRLRYNYRLRVPFANKFIHDAWLAAVFGQRLDNRLIPVHDEQLTQVSQPRRLSLREQIEIRVLRLLASGGNILGFRFEPIYMMPLETTYAMQMQSNLYRANLRNCL
jgi:Flp pilus assembly pilin Flp